MTEPKNENNEVVTQEQNGLFNYANKLPDNLTEKDVAYLQNKIDSGKSTEYPKPLKIRASIEMFIKKHTDTEAERFFLLMSLSAMILFSFMLAFSSKEITVGNAALLYVWPIWVLTSCTYKLMHTLTAISIVENKYLKTVRASIVRNASPILALLIPTTLLFDRYTGHTKELVQPSDFAASLVIIISAYAAMKLTKIKADKALAKFKIEN